MIDRTHSQFPKIKELQQIYFLPVFILFFLFVLIVQVFSQPVDREYEHFKQNRKALGMFASSGAGEVVGGLHYAWLGDTIGFQFTFGGLYDPEATWDRIMDVGVMLDIIKPLYHSQHRSQLGGQLYLWGTIGGKAFIESEYIPLSDKNEAGPVTAVAIAGTGIGIEIMLGNNFSFPVQFGYYAQGPAEVRLNFGIGSGLRYRF